MSCQAGALVRLAQHWAIRHAFGATPYCRFLTCLVSFLSVISASRHILSYHLPRPPNNGAGLRSEAVQYGSCVPRTRSVALTCCPVPLS